MSEQNSERTVRSCIGKILQLFGEDQITVYAAQASFFVIISVVPFLSLLISVASFFIPADTSEILSGYSVSKEISELLGTMLDDLYNAPKVSLLSFSALVTLWSASKGISAIRNGIGTVYKVELKKGMVFHRLNSLLWTLGFLVLFISTVALLMFGDFIGSLINIVSIRDLINIWSTPFIFIFLCIMLVAMYVSVAKQTNVVKSKFLFHVPGAVFGAFGWILFSDVYSLYIKHFPNASYIYGSLAAICLSMLWLYFCMIILLLGAEVNKAFSSWHVRMKEKKAEKKKRKEEQTTD